MAAKLPNIQELVQAGINPKTGLPLKMDTPCELHQSMVNMLRVIDEQDAVNRYTWYNLPDTLDGELLERILYYKGQAMFFYMPQNDQFYFLPYALDGTIDVYGRFTGVTPLPFTGTDPWIKGLVKTPVYDLPIGIDIDTYENSCVLLHDYCKGISQTITPRSALNAPLVNVEAECIPLMRTSLIGRCGTAGMRVNNQDEYSNVEAMSNATYNAALSGKRWVPVVGSVDFQTMDTTAPGQPTEFMQAMQSLDNLRLRALGLSNGGMFEKQGTILQSEADAAGSNTDRIYQDGLRIRQNFCNTVNAIWGLGIWCESNEMMMDMPEQAPDQEEEAPVSNEEVPQDE